jgi:hypothetical protein
MAKTKAPFLSLGASGKLAGTLVASTWKGIKVMREYVVPANPNTAGQVTQRGYMTACVNAWKNYFTLAAMRTAWNLTALTSGMPMSGFNAFVSSLSQILPTTPAASYGSLCAAFTGMKPSWHLLNVDDGATGDEAGNFEVWQGATPTSMVLAGTAAIAAGNITGPVIGAVGEEKHVKLRKGGYDRSGISKITLIA